MRATRPVLVLVVSTVSLLAACVAQPPARPAIAALPPLAPDASRVYIASGSDRGYLQTETMSTVRQVGPVYFDGKLVGSTGQNEYFVIDVKPGTHEVACSPLEPVRNFIEVRKVSFEAGETKQLVCDMTTPTASQWETYRSRSYLEERLIDQATSKNVGYTKRP